MPAKRYLPSDSTLVEWAKVMTHQQIADRIYEDTGYKVARSTVSAALSRAGETNRVRYESTIPWPRIKVEHNHHYAVTMLRLLARREDGQELNDSQSARLDSWLQRLEDEDAVVVYRPDTEDGFYYVRRQKSDGLSITRL